METLDDAFARQSAEARQAKAAQWAEMQERAPELAEAMKLLAKAFGKLRYVEVKYHD